MNSEENWGIRTIGVFLNSSDTTNENGFPYTAGHGYVQGATQNP